MDAQSAGREEQEPHNDEGISIRPVQPHVGCCEGGYYLPSGNEDFTAEYCCVTSRVTTIQFLIAMVTVWGGFGPDHAVPSTLRPLTGTYILLLTYLQFLKSFIILDCVAWLHHQAPCLHGIMSFQTTQTSLRANSA